MKQIIVEIPDDAYKITIDVKNHWYADRPYRKAKTFDADKVSKARFDGEKWSEDEANTRRNAGLLPEETGRDTADG